MELAADQQTELTRQPDRKRRLLRCLALLDLAVLAVLAVAGVPIWIVLGAGALDIAGAPPHPDRRRGRRLARGAAPARRTAAVGSCGLSGCVIGGVRGRAC